MLGESVILRNVRNQTVVKTRPKQRLSREGKDNNKQDAARQRFGEAIQWARLQLASPESRALYLKGITDKKRTAFVVALTDYLNAPEVSIFNVRGYRGNAGDLIVVKASDDFEVTSVEVEIRDPSGGIIEAGDATRDTSRINLWQYRATVANATLTGTKIRVFAYDRPGNSSEAEIVL